MLIQTQNTKKNKTMCICSGYTELHSVPLGFYNIKISKIRHGYQWDVISLF